MFEQSKWFFEEFCKIFAEDSIYRQEAIRSYTDNKSFTDFVIDKINNIIEEKGYHSQKEYFRIDAIGYKSHYDDLEKVSGFKRHLWDLAVAVEHENDSTDWSDEVIKLAHVCCPLRVVIGYVPKNHRDNALKGDMKRLEYISSDLQKLTCVDNVKNGEFVVILGNSDTKSPEDYFNYRAYVLNSKKFCFELL